MIRMILDTDTYNEVDDQFALVYVLLSPEAVKVVAIHAAPFHNKNSPGPCDGMERSYQEKGIWAKRKHRWDMKLLII